MHIVKISTVILDENMNTTWLTQIIMHHFHYGIFNQN